MFSPVKGLCISMPRTSETIIATAAVPKYQANIFPLAGDSFLNIANCLSKHIATAASETNTAANITMIKPAAPPAISSKRIPCAMMFTVFFFGKKLCAPSMHAQTNTSSTEYITERAIAMKFFLVKSVFIINFTNFYFLRRHLPAYRRGKLSAPYFLVSPLLSEFSDPFPAVSFITGSAGKFSSVFSSSVFFSFVKSFISL